MRQDAGENELARMRLAQAVESWHCGLAQNHEVFKAEADFASDCNYSNGLMHSITSTCPVIKYSLKENRVVSGRRGSNGDASRLAASLVGSS
jgi:hypothetical protein